MSRFPVRFPDVDKVTFQCATPSLALRGLDRIVYKIGSTGEGDDERVLLQILSSLDKAYAAKYEAKIEEARADMLSSSMTFQVVADEIRSAQEECEKKWEKEVRSLKEQMSTNQKRLFLLEREKEGLAKAAASSEGTTVQLRQSVLQLTRENDALREQQGDLEAQIAALRDVAALVGALARHSWQQQISAMSEWLRTGAELLGAPSTTPELARELALSGSPLGSPPPVPAADPSSAPIVSSPGEPPASDC